MYTIIMNLPVYNKNRIAHLDDPQHEILQPYLHSFSKFFLLPGNVANSCGFSALSHVHLDISDELQHCIY